MMMKSFFTIVLIMIVPVCLFSQAATPAPTPVPTAIMTCQPAYGQAHGYVTDAETDSPVSGATINAIAAIGTTQATSDDQGYYSMNVSTCMLGEQVTFIVTAPGYHDLAYDNGVSLSTNIDFALTPVVSGSTIVDITVIDADTKAPLAGVRVQVLGADPYGMPVVYTGNTDGNGGFYYVITGMSVDRIGLSLDGYDYLTILGVTTGTFELTKLTGPFTITIDSDLSYLVDLDPPGGVYNEPTHVTLTARDEINPDGSGYYFVEWQGDITSTAPIVGFTVTYEMVIIPVYESRGPLPVPAITGISPASGPTGTTVTITGNNFQAEDNIVLFGPAGDPVYQSQTPGNSYDGTTIAYTVYTTVNPRCRYDEPRCTDPFIYTTPGTYEISVTNGVHTSNVVQFEVTGSDSTPDPTPVVTPAPTSNPGIMGDVNSDGTVDIIDALLIAQYYVGLQPLGFYPTNADVNCDGSIDIVDALQVARYFVGLIQGFTC